MVAYATGEEFQHTYMLIGCAIAALIVTNLYWELVRPHSLHLRGAHAPHITLAAALRGSFTLDAPAFVAMAVPVLTARRRRADPDGRHAPSLAGNGGR